MRIQHNIPAMNAYRNYNNNTSALSKNLEKLSSGYKINRAGDDAAGLAISEKMRAQITGLQAAQKNVKDGVSLVKTAEGAMQEIQDMLNRMDYLATQSANGTYQDEVDRENLQKEVEALKTEINRIAESANFNGIKLLDGSLDGSAAAKTATTTFDTILPDVGATNGTDTVLHQDPATDTTGTTFSVDLHNTVFKNATGGNDFVLKVGTDTVATLVGDDSGALSGGDLVDAIIAKVQAENANGDAELTISGQTFTVTKGTEGDNRIVFTQKVAPTNSTEYVNGDMAVSITGDIGSDTVSGAGGGGAGGTAAVAAVYESGSQTLVTSGGTPATAATYDSTTVAGASTTAGAVNTLAVSIGGKSYDVENTNVDAADQVTAWVAEWNADTANNGGWTASVEADGSIKLTSASSTSGQSNPLGTGTLNDGDDAGTNATVTGITFTTASTTTGTTSTNYTLSVDGKSYDIAKTNTSLADQLDAWAAKYNADATNTDFTAAKNASGDGITLTAKTTGSAQTDTTGLTGGTFNNGADATGTPGGNMTIGGHTAAVTANTLAGQLAEFVAHYNANAADKADWTASVDGDKIKFTAKTAGALNTTGATQPTGTNQVTAGADAVAGGGGAGAGGGTTVDGVIGVADYNTKTTAIKNVTADSGQRLASTTFNLTAAMVTDKGTLTVGKDTYTFTTDESQKGSSGKVYIGDLLGTDGKIDATNLGKVADRITDAAKGNTTYTVGNEGGKMTFVELQNQNNYTGANALTSFENIAKTFNYTTVTSSAGKSLTLQIGDTSEVYNQMAVDVGDMHTDAMGTTGGATITEVDISTQKGAQDAVQTIKDAINYVSSVRGDLGAIQNRLEHTQNNLSVMAENIQDAESTIRDTDVAEEMMSYVKNNILVQSAQAMLAQANQLPQGVLQLLG